MARTESFVLDHLPREREQLLLSLRFPIAMGPAFFASLETAGYLAYKQLLGLLAAEGGANPVRIWNFLPSIHHTDRDGVDAYMAFNRGRRTAWSTRGLPPAATGIGHRMDSSMLEVHCLASSHPVIAIENPRQTPAYRYSAKYGPIPPLFSRALIHLHHEGPELLISGTASIVGEETLHAGDAEAQAHETIRNLEALTSSSNLGAHGFEGLALTELESIQVYVRRQRDFPAIRRVLEAAWPGQRILYAQADICRRDLLLEIEARAPLRAL